MSRWTEEQLEFEDRRLLFDSGLEEDDFYLTCDEKVIETMSKKFGIDTNGKSRVRIAVELNRASMDQIFKELEERKSDK